MRSQLLEASRTDNQSVAKIDDRGVIEDSRGCLAVGLLASRARSNQMTMPTRTRKIAVAVRPSESASVLVIDVITYVPS